jgi:SAM-dependent methyltransferase
MPNEPAVGLRWGAPPERAARIEHGEARLLRLAVARDATGRNRWFEVLGVDESCRARRFRADDDVIELTVRVQDWETDEVVLEQRIWLAYTMRDGDTIPIASAVPPVALPPQRTRTSRSYLGLEISDRNLRSTIPPQIDESRPERSRERYGNWHGQHQFPAEYLLAHIDRRSSATWPAPFMVDRQRRSGTSSPDLRATVAKLAPWFVPFRLDDGTCTLPMSVPDTQRKASRIMFRRDLITGTVQELLGEELAKTTVLDIGCNSGFFSLDIAHRGAQHVDGIDLREENIAQAEFLANHYGLDKVAFRVLDADQIPTGQRWDVVLNLGVLYHVVNPLQFLQQTYQLCRRFAIIDTICHTEPVSAFVLLGDKNTSSASEGREAWEFHPTYRGAIDAIRYAGFSDVIEVLGYGEVPHPLYDDGERRCFLAIK